ncbi:MAG: hypothetical protein B6244_07445 [Candidatus Cloacimonetes bacterium 4572_55]|nr:MAG: hypothetical protein B6244_07445 [Candidatus Cloacimonetes bacterium 4572_55]
MTRRIIIGFLSLISLQICIALALSQSESDSLKTNGQEPDSTLVDSLMMEPVELKIRQRKVEVIQPQSVPFGVGEYFLFSIEYGPIKAGTATLEIPKLELVEGFPCYQIHSLARSGKTFSLFFRVHDDVFSFMDTRKLFTRKFTKSLEEGKYRARQEINYDQQNHIATYHNGKQYELPPDVHDVLSAFYYTRCLDLEVGDEVEIETHADRKNYPLLVKALRRERVKVPAGEFDCLVLEPVLRSTGIFQQKGTLTVWLTDDKIKMPVLMKSKVFIGSINAKLRSYRLGVGN